MSKILLSFFVVFLFISCTKNSDSPTDNNKGIILNDLKITGDSIKLSWNKPDTLIGGYEILRREDSLASFVPIGITYDPLQTFYVDNNVPYTPYVEYQVAALVGNGLLLYSNTKIYQRSDINVMDIQPFDVLCDKQNNWLYFFEKSGRITIYDYNNDEVVKQISTDATIGFSDVAIHNGIKELYVPRNDGWVFIYDATTLKKLDQISIGLESSSVVYSNNLLFVSTAAWTNGPLRVFDRDTKNLVEKTGDFELTRLKKIPGTNTNIIEITLYIGPTDQDFYNFNSKGKLTAHQNDIYHGDYPLDANVYEMFPDGTKYITSSAGDIFDIDMNFKTTLPRGNDEFTCFEFNTQDNLIYGGISEKGIKAYSLQNYVYKTTIPTKGYPYKIFNDNGSLICVSQTTEPSIYGNIPQKIFIEHL